jgi:hypothetical protein
VSRHSLVYISILCAVGGLPASTALLAQQKVQRAEGSRRVDLAFVYTSERTSKANTTQGVWLQGGSIELGADIYRGFGIGADITGLHTSSIGSSSVPFSELTATFGPRYRLKVNRKLSAYGQGLIGEGNAFYSLLPGAVAAQSGSNALAVKVGGGIDYQLNPRFAVRAVDAAWVRTQYGNSTNNQQNDLRLGAGLVVLFGH